MKLDLHVHSDHSRDARGSIMDLAHAARAKGLLGFAVTDHDTTDGHAAIAAAAAATGRLIVPGIEVTTAGGHLLAYGVSTPPPRGLGLAATIELVEEQGGVAAAAHPLRLWSGAGPRALTDLAHQGVLYAAEARNARERPLAIRNTERVVRELGLSMVGGSDAHWVRDIGTCTTVFDEPPVTVDDVLEGIRRGRCHAEGTSLPRRSVAAHQASLLWQKVTGRGGA